MISVFIPLFRIHNCILSKENSNVINFYQQLVKYMQGVNFVLIYLYSK